MHCFEYVYENTPAGSPLRRLFVRHCAFVADAKTLLSEESESFPKEMLMELSVYLVEEFPRALAEDKAEEWYMHKYLVSEGAGEGKDTEEDGLPRQGKE